MKIKYLFWRGNALWSRAPVAGKPKGYRHPLGIKCTDGDREKCEQTVYEKYYKPVEHACAIFQKENDILRKKISLLEETIETLKFEAEEFKHERLNLLDDEEIQELKNKIENIENNKFDNLDEIAMNRLLDTARNELEAQCRARDIKGYVYIMKVKNRDIYKIGKSRHPEYRRIQLQTYEELQILYTKEFDDAYAIEEKVHCNFSKYRIKKEWYTMTPQEISTVINFINDATTETRNG